MPYSKISELPNNIRKLPVKKQRQWMAIWNSMFKQTGSEERAFKAANAILSKERKMENVFYLDTLKAGDWIQVLRTGKWTHPRWGELNITDKDLNDMVKNFSEEVAIDYRHGSGKADSKPEDGKAAGWAKALEKRDNTLWAKPEWTEEAAEYITKGEYRKTSAEFHPNYMNPEAGKKQGATLLAIALTNRPFVSGMAPVVLSNDIDLYELNPIATEVMSDSDPTDDKHKQSTSKEVTPSMEKFKEFAIKLELEPQEDWEEEDFVKAFEAHIEGLKEQGNGDGKIKLEDGQEFEKKDVIKLQEQVQEQGKSIKLMQAEKTADGLVQEKKILPKERDYVVKLAQESDELLKDFLDTREDGSFVKFFEEKGGAGEGKDAGDKTDGEKFLSAVEERQTEKELTFTEALNQIKLEQPELAKAYAEENR